MPKLGVPLKTKREISGYIGVIISGYMGFRVSQNQGYHFGDPNNKDCRVFGRLYWDPSLKETTTYIQTSAVPSMGTAHNQ